MKAKIAAGVTCAILALGALPLLAHHSFAAEYDQGKSLTLKGKFTKFDWINPHSWVYFDVVDKDGKVTNWGAETPPPNSLYRDGWRKDMFKVGEEIQVTGFAAKDGSPKMWSNGVTIVATGVRMTMGSRPPNEVPDAGTK